MFIKKRMILIFILLIFISLTSVNAVNFDNQTDLDGNLLCENIQVDSDITAENQSSNLGDGLSSFTELRNIVSLPGTISLNTNYFYSENDKALIRGEGIPITVPLTIDGQGHTIDANYQTLIFRISNANVVLKNIVFAHAKSQPNTCPTDIIDGSALNVASSQVTIINCTFMANEATQNGGAIYARGSSELTIQNSNFYNNHAAGEGGAIYANAFTLTNNQFLNNKADENGGAVYKTGVRDASFVNNEFNMNVAGSGGAIYADNMISLNNCSFRFNNASDLGGAVYAEALHVNSNLINMRTDFNRFYNNSAKKGGAIYAKELRNIDEDGSIVFGGDLVLCEFENNTAESNGGAVYLDVDASFLRISQCTFNYNKITDSSSVGSGGSAIYVGCNGLDTSFIVTVEYNIFYHNTIGDFLKSVLKFDYIECDVRYNWWGENNVNFTQMGYIEHNSHYVSDSDNVVILWDDAFITMDMDSTQQVGLIMSSMYGHMLQKELLNFHVAFTSNDGYLNNIDMDNFHINVDFTPIKAGNVKIKSNFYYMTLPRSFFVNVDGNGISNPSKVGKWIVGTLIAGSIIGFGVILFVDQAYLSPGGDGSPDEPFTTLQAAIDKANDGDIIYINPGTYSGEGNENLYVPKNLTFVDISGNTIIDGGSKSRIFSVYSSKLNVYGITFKNAYDANGAAIRFNKPVSDSIINASFINNSAKNHGGAIYFADAVSNVSVEGIFINNTAQFGNSIYITDKSNDVLVKDSIFLNAKNNNLYEIYSEFDGSDVKNSWFGSNKNPVNEKVNTLNQLFMNVTIIPNEFKVGQESKITLDICSHDSTSGITSKYTNSKLDNLKLSLSSNDGTLNTNEVKFGEQFSFIPFNNASSVTASIENVNFTISPSSIYTNDLVKIYKNQSQFEAKFSDYKGNYLTNGMEIEFRVNGVTYARQVNDDGFARLNINLNPGVYKIVSTNKITGESHTNTITVLSKIFNSNDLVKYYKNDTQFIIQLRGDRGQILEGEEVTFSINGVVYTRTTNETGHAKLNINLNPGEYIITTKYGDLYESNNITVKSIFKELLNIYPNSYSVKLLNGQGKAYANQLIKFNIGGIFYESITNDSGIAVLKLSLMKGQYIITAMYDGLCVGTTLNAGDEF